MEQVAAAVGGSAALSPYGVVLRRRVLFLGRWAQGAFVKEAARAWVRRLATLLAMDLDCQVAEPPFSTEDLDCREFWLNPVPRSDEAREKLLQKQVFTGLTQMLQQTRWKSELLVRLGQGGPIAALAALPLVTEAACRSRATPMEVMRECRETWANVRAIVVINPAVVPH